MDLMEPSGLKLTEMDHNEQNWTKWTEVDQIDPSGSKLNIIGQSGSKWTKLDRNTRLM